MSQYTCQRCQQRPVENRDKGLCASCAREDRRLENAKAPKMPAHLKKVSAKRAVENKEYARLRRDYLEAYPVCEVVECHRKSSQIHHIRGRANDLLNDVNYFLAVCDVCHQRIHAEPIWAEASGYIEKRSIGNASSSEG